MDLRALRYVVTLAEELHFGRAAGRHFISAQPFGQAVGRLERELGYRLFERTSRRVAITPAGERFVHTARGVLAGVDALAGAGRDAVEPAPDQAGQPAGELTVGVLGFGLAERWRPLRRLVARQRPDLRIGHRDLDLVNQYEAVRRGEVDVGVVMAAGPVDGLVFDRVLTMAPVAVVPSDSELARADRLRVADLAGRASVSVAVPGSWSAAWAGVGLDAAARRATGPVVRNPAAIPAAVATTGRVALHLEAARRFFPHPDVRFVPIDGPRGEICLATRAGDERPAVQAFRRAARALAQP
ncbi:MAG TPA: LysR substrate-binding domain-containing protein [Pseudonocardia sp.]|nr:LysR substrate-binding domain-containing protein [Pseudonocardia sp.]